MALHRGEGGFDPDLLRHLGNEVIASLPQALATAHRLAQGWDVALDGWLPGATGSLLLTGGPDLVLRIPIRAAEIVTAFSGHGGGEILHADPATGATLMPRLRPGTTLAEASEEEAVEACADLILRLRGAQGCGPSVAEDLEPTLQARPLPATLRKGLAGDAARLARHLLDTAPPSVFLHADLHHFNVLRHGDEWVAIDPEGMTGDPAYECAAFLRNPVPELASEPDLQGILKRRIDRFAERLGDPPERIWGWALVRTAQCVSWSDASLFHAPWTAVLAALDALWIDLSLLPSVFVDTLRVGKDEVGG